MSRSYSSIAGLAKRMVGTAVTAANINKYNKLYFNKIKFY